MKQVQLLALPQQHLRAHGNPCTGVAFIDMTDMGFSGEIAAAGSDIVVIAANDPHEPVRGLRERIQIARLCHVAVIVGPIQWHRPMQGPDRLGQVGLVQIWQCSNGAVMGVQQGACAPILRLERAHHAHQVVIADAFQIADGMHARLGIRLICDQVDQFVREIWYVHKFGPGPFQRRAELGHEMAHSSFATSHAIGFKQAHLRPADTKPIADGIINFLGRGDPVFDQPQRFAPDSFKEAVGDMCVDFFFYVQRVHADISDHALRLRNCRGVIGVCGDQFDQRQQIDRVERVGHDDLAGSYGTVLQFTRFEAGGGGADDRIHGAGSLQFSIDFELQIKPFWNAFLNPGCSDHGIGDRVVEAEPAFFWKSHIAQARQAATGIIKNLANLAFGVRVRVEYLDVPTAEQEARGPTSANHAAANDGCCLGHGVSFVVGARPDQIQGIYRSCGIT